MIPAPIRYLISNGSSIPTSPTDMLNIYLTILYLSFTEWQKYGSYSVLFRLFLLNKLQYDITALLATALGNRLY